MTYRKISKISPGAYIFQRPFLRGLFFEGSYLRREICVSKSIGLALQLERNWPFLLCFSLYLREISKKKPLEGLYSDRRFNEGFFALRFCGAYTTRQMLYNITWHMLYNTTRQMLYNVTWHMLYNTTRQMLHNITDVL